MDGFFFGVVLRMGIDRSTCCFSAEFRFLIESCAVHCICILEGVLGGPRVESKRGEGGGGFTSVMMVMVIA